MNFDGYPVKLDEVKSTTFCIWGAETQHPKSKCQTGKRKIQNEK